MEPIDVALDDRLGDDLVLLVQAVAAALGDQVLADVRSAVDRDVRFHDGYVFQHLVAGPCTVSELARRLGVTQQAASKQVADLERRGLVRRRRDPGDARARPVELSPRGRRAVQAARSARSRADERAVELLGARRHRALVDALAELAAESGGAEVLRRRQLVAESAR